MKEKSETKIPVGQKDSLSEAEQHTMKLRWTQHGNILSYLYSRAIYPSSYFSIITLKNSLSRRRRWRWRMLLYLFRYFWQWTFVLSTMVLRAVARASSDVYKIFKTAFLQNKNIQIISTVRETKRKRGGKEFANSRAHTHLRRNQQTIRQTNKQTNRKRNSEIAKARETVKITHARTSLAISREKTTPSIVNWISSCIWYRTHSISMPYPVLACVQKCVFFFLILHNCNAAIVSSFCQKITESSRVQYSNRFSLNSVLWIQIEHKFDMPMCV